MLQHYEGQYNWQGNEFPLAIQKIGKFEKKNRGTIANVLFNSKNGIYTSRRSERNGRCSKQVGLSIIVEGEKNTTQQ